MKSGFLPSLARLGALALGLALLCRVGSTASNWWPMDCYYIGGSRSEFGNCLSDAYNFMCTTYEGVAFCTVTHTACMWEAGWSFEPSSDCPVS